MDASTPATASAPADSTVIDMPEASHKATDFNAVVEISDTPAKIKHGEKKF
jgi:hypothetical protein